jgi:thioredoxin-like negative regulator of GroEL
MTKVLATPEAVRPTRRREVRIVLAILVAGGLLWVGWAWWSDQTYRAAIMAIELEMANGRFGIAARDLNKLLQSEPGSDEAAILLGRCEQERGRLQAAAAALARVPYGSELSHKAILARMRLCHDQGQFAAAERLINEAALDPRNDKAHVRALLVPIYSQLGRLDEAQQLLRDWWESLNRKGEGASERAIDQVRMHVELAFRPNPVENVRAYLDQAYRMAPDDNRVWLGRANLAIHTGDFGQAKTLLDACRNRLPEDVPVWSSWLSLGVASSRFDLARQALAHLPADACTPAQRLRLGAWLCARRSDRDAEHRNLKQLVELDPDDRNALGRLAKLADMAGRPAEGDEWRARKAEVDQLRSRYQRLFDRNQPIRDAEEMARIAERLGRIFEARGFLTVEISQDPEREDLRQILLRLCQVSAMVTEQRKTLAEALASELGDDLKLGGLRTIDGVPSP